MIEFLTQDWILELGWIVAKIMVVIGPLLLAVAYLRLPNAALLALCSFAKGRMWLAHLVCFSLLPMRLS